jgi:hypothetical protein
MEKTGKNCRYTWVWRCLSWRFVFSFLFSFNFLLKGFLAYLALGKNVDQCVNAALYCAYENLQRLGCQFSDKPNLNDQLLYEKK